MALFLSRMGLIRRNPCLFCQDYASFVSVVLSRVENGSLIVENGSHLLGDSSFGLLLTRIGLLLSRMGLSLSIIGLF